MSMFEFDADAVNEPDDADLIGYSGLDGLGDNGEQKRLKQPTREADWAVIVDRLMTSFNLTYDELSEMTGISVSLLCDVRKEKQVFNSGNKALRLLGLFTLNIGRNNVPLLGDFNEING